MAPTRRSRNTRSRESGYDHNRTAPSQFREILNMEDEEEEYDEIIATIKRLTGEVLNADMTGRSQKGKITSIERQLIAKYPNTFGAAVQDSEKRLHFLYKYILYVHSHNKMYRDKAKAKETQNTQNNTKVHTMSTRRSSPPLIPHSVAEERAAAIEISSSDNEHVSKLPKGTKRDVQSKHPLRASRRISATFSQASSSKVLSQNRSSLAFSRKPNIKPSSAGIPSDIDVSSPIYEFLDTCLPSMKRHLHSFLDFGCDTSEHLFGMSLWQPEMIQEFLNKLPPSRSGEELTEMEKLIIQNHLLTYFKS